MDRIEEYRDLIKNILTEHAQHPPSVGEVESIAVFDDGKGSYQLMDIGWSTVGRVHAVLIHVRLRNGKFWIEYDGTEYGVAQELVDAGIPRSDIVLAFHSVTKRKYTEFAVS